jgi:hypothetical protein
MIAMDGKAQFLSGDDGVIACPEISWREEAKQRTRRPEIRPPGSGKIYEIASE